MANSKKIEQEEWFQAVTKTVSVLSRTYNGLSDTTSSYAKPKLIARGGNFLKEKSAFNLTQSLEYLWENRHVEFASPVKLMGFINKLAGIINNNLLQSGQSFHRTWRTKFNHVAPEKIEIEYSKFCGWLFSAINKDDPIITAALIEKWLNGRVHPFADGCGRTSRLLAAFILLRQNLLPPQFNSFEEYYNFMDKSDEEWIEYYHSKTKRRP